MPVNAYVAALNESVFKKSQNILKNYVNKNRTNYFFHLVIPSLCHMINICFSYYFLHIIEYKHFYILF